MSARDELAEMIYDDKPWLGWGAGGQLTRPIAWSDLDEEDKDNFRPLADAILAAGYRKPRTIRTLDELEALSLPAIIDSPSGGPAKIEYYAGPGRQKYVEPLFCDDDGGDESYSPKFFATFGLPATVLHEPEATA